jgi:pimeloyl-ACP methyl ester carboxylesterase
MKAIKASVWVAGVLVVAAAISFWERPLSYYGGAIDLCESLRGVESRTAIVAGHRVHYLIEGPVGGPAVVLVHGLGGRAEDWRKLTPYLVKAGYRVYRPELLGYGRSEQPADFSYSVRDEAKVVVGFLDALGLKQVDLGGWSMGGWVVQEVASANPERVRRLMLFDAAGIMEPPTWDTALFTPETPAELDELDALLMPHPPKLPGFVVRDVLRISDQNAWVIHKAVYSMLTGQDTTDALLPQLKMPVLIVWGAEDRLLPLRQAEKIHRLVPQSQLEVIAGCGHLAPGECADQIGPKVVEFVKR